MDTPCPSNPTRDQRLARIRPLSAEERAATAAYEVDSMFTRVDSYLRAADCVAYSDRVRREALAANS